MNRVLFFWLILLLNISLFGQNDSLNIQTRSTDKKVPYFKQNIVPLTLIGSGLIINYAHGSLSKESIQENIRGGLDGFQTNVDEFTWFIPGLTMYAADLFKVKSKNDAFTQTKYLGVALITNTAITYGLKKITNEERPNGEGDSFPSGHTSNAFVMATVLFYEFMDSNPWIAYSGFAFATTTGVLRVMNDKHWVSDVLVGAGIGMLVTDLVYRIEPLKNWQPFDNKKLKAMVSPSYQDDALGLYLNFQF